MNIRNTDLTGRILSYITINGRINYFKVINQKENWFYLKNISDGRNFTTCINNTCVYNFYELVPSEYSINERKNEYSDTELINIKMELQAEGYTQDAIDKLMSEFFINT